MKRFVLGICLLIGISLLAACSVSSVAPGPTVSGSLNGDWSDLGNVDVAIVGVTESLVTNLDNQFQAVDGNFTQTYSVALPTEAAAGVYKVIAFVDNNDNNELDLLEVRGNSGNKYLVFSSAARGDFAAGWNAVEGITGEPRSGLGFTGFDLRRARTPF